MRKSRFTEEQITDALWLADTGKKRVYRLPGGSVTAHESQTHAHKHCYSAGLRYSPARTNIGALDFFDDQMLDGRAFRILTVIDQ